jgi:hypothetical protein
VVGTGRLQTDVHARISGSANSRCDFVIAPYGEMTSVPAGTTPFFLEIKSAPESSVEGIPPSLDDAADLHHTPALPFRYSVCTWQPRTSSTQKFLS